MADDDDSDLTTVVIPERMHFPLAKAFAVAHYNAGMGRLMIRRVVWDGATTYTDENDVEQTYDLKWLYYEGGVWFVFEADANDNPSHRVAVASDMAEVDFRAWDWTTLGTACSSSGSAKCSVNSEEADLFKWVRPYDEFEEIDLEPTLDLNAPNAGPCGDTCSPGEIPPNVVVEDREGPGQRGFEGTANAHANGGAGDGGGGGGPAGGGDALGGAAGGGGAGGAGGAKTRKIRLDPPSASIAISNIADSLPACIPALAVCGGVAVAAAIQEFTIAGFDVTLTDTDDPGDIWFVKAFCGNDLVLDTTMSDGDTESAVVGETYQAMLNGGAIGITAQAWKNGAQIGDHDAVVVPDICP